MKRLFLVLGVLLTAMPLPVRAQRQHSFSPGYLDSVEVSLLTCQPHDEVYSLYGHTALRWHDLHAGQADLAFNWGVFNFHAPHFVLRFVFGLTDYELGGYPYQLFQREYQHFGSMVTEQLLNLTAAEKQRLYDALLDNLRDENRVYRYNYFYNNCTTKARDIVEQCVEGRVVYAEPEDDGPATYRETVHLMARRNPWARFGNDVLLGVKADRPTTQREQQFLPDHLMYDFDRAQIYVNGTYRPLVVERRTAVPPGVQLSAGGFPLSPRGCAVLLLVVGALLSLWEWKRGKPLLLWDALLMLAAGAVGVVLTLMLFSQHPTVSLNLQLIFYNPLHLLFLWPVVRGGGSRYWLVCPVLFFLFLVGWTFQTYAEGVWAVACCLLFQSYVHISIDRKKLSK